MYSIKMRRQEDKEIKVDSKKYGVYVDAMFKECNIRSLAKAVSWRIAATVATVLIVYAFTGNVSLSLGVGSVELVVKIVLYFGHERCWNVVQWGRKRA